ncbi:histidine phosphatase family protein [Myxococcota bacterium]|nr:histidine phosphatase family protein [Myxococcota bacterium]
MSLRRLVLIRHGETVGRSSIRFFGSTDVELSDEGRAQMRGAALRVRGEHFDRWVASPLRRSWQAARIVSAANPVHLQGNLREVDFGEWEGLTAEEIQVRDPVLYAKWCERSVGFAYPGGESRASFEERVVCGAEWLIALPVISAVAILHKGVIRTLAGHLTSDPLGPEEPELGGVIGLKRISSGGWVRTSDP